MREEQQLQGIVLKSQPIGEADSLVTWFTRERGKVRTMVTGARRPQSKLSFALLPGSVAALRIAGHGETAGIYRLIGAVPLQVYIRDFDQGRGMVLLWLQEVVLRATADEQVHEQLFSVLVAALEAISKPEFTQDKVSLIRTVVTIQLCAALGFGMSFPYEVGRVWYFNAAAGGFSIDKVSGDDIAIPVEGAQRLHELVTSSVNAVLKKFPGSFDELLARTTSEFLEYQLERSIRSGRLFGAILQ